MPLITTTDALADFCREAADGPYVTVDTEFMRERTFYPELCVVQVAGESSVAVIDAQAEGIDLAPLWEVLKSIVPREPRSSARAKLWRWKEVKPLLLEAGRVITAEEAGCYKPDPRPYRQALATLGVAPGEAAFVAGSGYDMFGTSAVGLRTYWHNRVGLARPEGAPAAALERPTLDDLLPWLEGRLS